MLSFILVFLAGYLTAQYFTAHNGVAALSYTGPTRNGEQTDEVMQITFNSDYIEFRFENKLTGELRGKLIPWELVKKKGEDWKKILQKERNYDS
jgi:hypothetical protein